MHLTFFSPLYYPSGQHCRLWGQPVGDLLPGECRGYPGPECSLPGAAQGLGEAFSAECNTFLRERPGQS